MNTTFSFSGQSSNETLVLTNITGSRYCRLSITGKESVNLDAIETKKLISALNFMLCEYIQPGLVPLTAEERR